MSRNDFSRLFDQLESLSVGFGPVFREFQYQTNNYPPHNIIRVSDTVFILELAVAGFKKSEISVEEHQGIVTIQGTKSTGDSDKPADEYQYRGIASRSFSKSLRIAEFYEIVGATLEDGMLSITFAQNIPEAAKPKLIAIK